MITFKNITKNNYEAVAKLDPGEENLKYISQNSMLMLSAHYNKMFLEMKAIYYNEILIGFFMLTTEILPIYLECFMIDKKYHNKGFGNMCIKKILRYIKTNYSLNKLYLSTSNPIAFHLYQKNGFVKSEHKLAIKYIQIYNEFLLVYTFN